MKNFCFLNNSKPLFLCLVLLSVSLLLGCNALNTLAEIRGNRNSATVVDSSGDDASAVPANLNAQTSAQCRNILRGDRRNKPNDRGELPADMPVPRGSVLCGYVDGQRATYYINEAVDKNALAQFYRDALPPQGFDLQMDNPTEGGGKFMVFGRGASESIQIQTTLSSLAEFRNMFSIAYLPPSDAHGNARQSSSGTTIMRGAGNSNHSNSTNAQNDNSPMPPDCGNNPLGSYKCAAELQSKLKSWQFSIEEKDERGGGGRGKTFTGERALPGNNRVVIHVMIAGVSRKDDGEWWYRFGSVAGQNDNGYRLYYKETNGWQRIESPPDDMGDLMTMSNVVSPLSAFGQTPAEAETINGQQCNHFRRTDSETGDVTDTWVSQTTGYALRVVFKNRSGYTKQNDFSRQNEALNFETPPGAQ